jgi:predicted amidohydrolase
MKIKPTMDLNTVNTHPISITQSNLEILVCKCGNKPYPSAKFYYKSRYSDEPTIGIIARVDKTHIYSTNGTPYHKNEIEVKPKHIAREEKLNELGI